MADRLVVWLYDTPVAELTPRPEFRIQLEWRPEGIERWGLGHPVLSVGLPIGAAIGPRDVRGLDFFENILPEGLALARMAALAGVRGVDTYGILRAFGRDCAGAIMMIPDGERPGGNETSGYSPMAPGGLRRVISALDVAPLGAAPERGFRPSLAGFQRKLLLGRAADGTWRLPYGDAPSTWILKPDGSHSMAANEATCLRLAAGCGLPAAEAELLDVAGLPVLAVRRYDRRDSPSGPIPGRIHQEDGCQATLTPPGLKYEAQGGPALRDLARLLRNFGDPRDVTSLLRRTTFNMAVGNADAHAKNFSVLHEPDSAAIELAPMYDVLSTIALELTGDQGQPMRADTHLGQRVGGQADIRKVTPASLVDEALGWGIRRQAAAAVVAETLDRVLTAIPATPGDERVLAVIRGQAERVRRGLLDADPGAEFGALADLAHHARGGHVEHVHGQALLVGQHERAGIHDPDPGGQRLVVGQPGVAHRVRIKVRVAVVDPVHAPLGHQQRVGVQFQGPLHRRVVGGHVRLPDAAREQHDLVALQVVQGPEPDERLRHAVDRHRGHDPDVGVGPGRERAPEHQRVHDGAQHPDVVRLGPADAPALGHPAAEVVPAADHDRDLYAEIVNGQNLLGDAGQAGRIDPGTARPRERLAAQLDENPAIARHSLVDPRPGRPR